MARKSEWWEKYKVVSTVVFSGWALLQVSGLVVKVYGIVAGWASHVVPMIAW